MYCWAQHANDSGAIPVYLVWWYTLYICYDICVGACIGLLRMISNNNLTCGLLIEIMIDWVHMRHSPYLWLFTDYLQSRSGHINYVIVAMVTGQPWSCILILHILILFPLYSSERFYWCVISSNLHHHLNHSEEFRIVIVGKYRIGLP